MPGLDPGIQLLAARKMDCRVKPGNDENSEFLHLSEFQLHRGGAAKD
jgi:hypothetical protein